MDGGPRMGHLGHQVGSNPPKTKKNFLGQIEFRKWDMMDYSLKTQFWLNIGHQVGSNPPKTENFVLAKIEFLKWDMMDFSLKTQFWLDLGH